MTYPTTIDNGTTLPNPSAGNFTNNPSHSGLHGSVNAAAIAIETKLGTGTSTPSGTNLLVSTGTGSSAWSKAAPTGAIVGLSDSQTLTNKTLTSPTINGGTLDNATVTVNSIAGHTTAGTGTIYGLSIAAGAFTTSNIIPTGALQANSVTSATLATNAVGGSNLSATAITIGNIQTSASDQTGITSSQVMVNLASGTSLSTTIPAGGRGVKVEGWITILQNSSQAGIGFEIKDGGVGGAAATTASANLANYSTTLASGFADTVYIYGVLTAPTPGVRQFGMSLGTSAGTVDVRNAAVGQGYLTVTLI